MSNALLSTHYGTVRLLLHVHVRRSVYGLRGPVLICRPRRTGDLPVLVHVVSQRARVLRLRRTEQSARDTALAVLPSSSTERSRRPVPSAFRSSIARPTNTSVYASTSTSGAARKTRGQDGFATLLSCRALSSPTTCRFSPALSEWPTNGSDWSSEPSNQTKKIPAARKCVMVLQSLMSRGPRPTRLNLLVIMTVR
jgi:hypothetical protein